MHELLYVYAVCIVSVARRENVMFHTFGLNYNGGTPSIMLWYARRIILMVHIKRLRFLPMCMQDIMCMRPML